MSCYTHSTWRTIEERLRPKCYRSDICSVRRVSDWRKNKNKSLKCYLSELAFSLLSTNHYSTSYPCLHISPGSIRSISIGWRSFWRFSLTASETKWQMLIFKKNLVNLQLITVCRLLPWNCCELLFQCLNVSELNSLSSSSGFNHFTLKKYINK